MPKEEEQEWPATFQELFCQMYNCRPEEYEKKLLYKTMFRHALVPAFIINLFSTEFSHIDRTEIQLLGGIRNPANFNRELDLFHGRNVRDKRLLRRLLRIRISGRRLLMERNKVTEWVNSRKSAGKPILVMVMQMLWLLQ